MTRARSATLVFSRDAIRRLDRLAVERFGMPSIILMENAGSAVASHISRLLPRGRIAVFCGPGNNGGDGLVAARHLHNRGHAVQVVLTARPDSYSGDAATNLAIARKMRLRFAARPSAPDLIIDALLGTGLDRPVKGPMAARIESINRLAAAGIPVVSIDLPSGMDADTGRPLGSCITADLTVTFCGWKAGFLHRHSRAFTGRIVTADIGVPHELAEALRMNTVAPRNE